LGTAEQKNANAGHLIQRAGRNQEEGYA